MSNKSSLSSDEHSPSSNDEHSPSSNNSALKAHSAHLDIGSAEAQGFSTHSRTQSVRRWMRGHLIGLSVFALLVLYAAIVPAIFEAGTPSFANSLCSPTAAHIFGTDHFGFDLFVRTAESLRVSLFIGLTAAVAATTLGVLVGLLAAGLGGVVDRIVMRINDAVNAIPHLILTVVIVALFQGSVAAIVGSIAVTHWSPVARIVRSAVLTVRASETVQCSYGAGASFGWVLRKHLAPAASGQALVAMAMLTPHAVWHESTVSFLGLGIQADEPSLGTLMDLAREDITRGAWWALVFPAMILLLTTMSGVSLTRGATARAERGVGKQKKKSALQKEAGAGRRGRRSEPAEPIEATSELGELRARGLGVEVGAKNIVCGVNLTVRRGEVAGLIGTSGSGKSTVGRALIGVVPTGARVEGKVSLYPAEVPDGNCAAHGATKGHLEPSGVTQDTEAGGSAHVAEADETTADSADWNSTDFASVRGSTVGFVPQAAALSFTPVRRIGTQLQEIIDRHGSGLDVEELLERVHLDSEVSEYFPHQLSGGMAQRAALAAALAGNPQFLIADEPTAALDPQLTKETLELLRSAAKDLGLGVLLISHDLEDLREWEVCDHIFVLHEGEVVESRQASEFWDAPQTDFSHALVAALPSGGIEYQTEVGERNA